MHKLICFHLYNDFSGSPKVLKTVLTELLNKGYIIYLISSKGGILDKLSHPNLTRSNTYSYHFSNSHIKTILKYISIQLYTFIISFRFLFCKDIVFYINTILPIGPAIAGKLMHKKIVYHYHENSFIKGRFYKILTWWMQKLADEIICVSTHQASYLNRKKNIAIIPNALPQDFINELKPNPTKAFREKTVLMLSSLKHYKGTDKFIQLAAGLPQFKFIIVINDNMKNIKEYLKNQSLDHITRNLNNLTIYPQQSQIAKFYNSASLVLNLSDKKYFIETFGLTILEAMAAGLPVITPTVGGVAEMVENGVNGYKIDVENFKEITCKINNILTNENLYIELATNALSLSKHYKIETTIDMISSCINKII